MLYNYLRTAIRNILKNKVISLINIIGLAFGLAACIIILSYTTHELSFDRFHDKSDRIYRCLVETKSDKAVELTAQTVAAIGPSLCEDFPEVVSTVRFRVPESKYLGYNNNVHFVTNVLYVDSTLFDIFSFRLLHGNPKTALTDPFSIVLSESTALKIFGTEDPIGKMILLDNKGLLTVRGIVEDAPSNSHIQYNAFISFSSLYKDENMHLDWNGGWAYYTYMLIAPGTDMEHLARKFPAFMDKHINYIFKGTSWSERIMVQPLLRIYLHSNLPGEIGPVGNLSYLLLFMSIALVIFIIACINFINLTTARLTTRLRETGIRKIFGARRVSILVQFMIESVVMNFIALLLAFIIAESILPLVSQFLGFHLVIYQASSLLTMAGLFFIIVFGILAGCYPALYLTSFNPVESFKNAIHVKTGGISMRKFTVLLQYTVSVAMIICSLFIFKQLHYIKHKDPGFEKENILAIPLPTREVSHKHDLLKSQFLTVPSVENICVSSDFPGRGLARNGYRPEGSQDAIMTNVLDGDEDLLPVLGLKIVKGRNFSYSFATDESKYLINEAYARSVNWTNPLGKLIERNGQHEVIGVIRDFNFAPLHEKIAPLIITMIPEEGFNFLLVKAKPGQLKDALKALRARWEQLVPDVPFDCLFLDEACRKVYIRESNLSQLVLMFTILAIFIAFLGLFGLSSHETERQTKNIGIRKVNGAKPGEIMRLLSVQFIKWVVYAFIIACPVAYNIMHNWLQQFAYKTTLSPWVFLLSGIIALAFAWLTVSWQCWLAVRRDPVEALRYE